MEAAGAARIAFNSLTPTFVAKALARVAEAEGLPLAPDAAKALAERCAGDLRAALEALQLAAAGAPAPPPSKKVMPAAVYDVGVSWWGWHGYPQVRRRAAATTKREPAGLAICNADVFLAHWLHACPCGRPCLAIVSRDEGVTCSLVLLTPRDSPCTSCASAFACNGVGLPWLAWVVRVIIFVASGHAITHQFMLRCYCARCSHAKPVLVCRQLACVAKVGSEARPRRGATPGRLLSVHCCVWRTAGGTLAWGPSTR